MKQKFNVTGMTCSACSAHVDKAVRKLEGVEEVNHYETVTEYPGGGRDVRKVIDVPGVPAQAAWTEQVPVQRYIRYTEEELAAREKERQQAEEAARLPETIASLTCQLTDLQLALCELYEGGGV